MLAEIKEDILWGIGALLLLLSIVTITCILSERHQTDEANRLNVLTRIAMEWAYFQGQRDAINGDVRIEKQTNGHYKWVKSCWDNDPKPPIFDPSVSEDLNFTIQNAFSKK